MMKMGFQFHLLSPIFLLMLVLSGNTLVSSSSSSSSSSGSRSVDESSSIDEYEQTECGCHCKAHVPWNITEELLEMLRKDIFDQLLVETKNLSQTIRKRTSAQDNRPSAVTMGSVGIAFFVFTILVMFIPDVMSGLRYLFTEDEDRPKVLRFVSNVK